MRTMDWLTMFKSWLIVLLCGSSLCSGMPGAKGADSNFDRSSDSESLKDIYDPVHGVKMGIPHPECDDGIHGIEKDWDPSSTDEMACYKNELNELNFQSQPKDINDAGDKMPQHVCMDEPIDYDTNLPLSGNHRPLWPKFGEYEYLPPQRWVHSLEHGAIALLYHPCMMETPQLEALKSLVRDCLGKHVISPYRYIPDNRPFALLAYTKARLIGYFNPKSEDDINMVIDFIKTNALEAPETHVLEDGQYYVGLKTSALNYSDLGETKSSVCAFLRRKRGQVSVKSQLKRMF